MHQLLNPFIRVSRRFVYAITTENRRVLGLVM